VTVKVQKGRDGWIDHGDDVAAPAAVPPIGSAKRLEFLPVHRRAAIAAVTTAGVDHCSIHESAHSDHRPGREPGRLLGEDVDDATTAPRAEFHGTCRQREQGVILASADVESGMKVSAALPDDDLAGADVLSAEALHA